MDYWDVKNTETLKDNFSKQRLILSSKTSITSLNRPHTSLVVVAERARELNRNQAFFQQIDEPNLRYIIAKNVTYELFVSIYNVNSGGAIVLRPTWPLDSREVQKIKDTIRKFDRPNLEMRFMGMQNGDASLMKVVDELHNEIKADMIEMDFFGKSARHIALDLKTGMSYDVLLFDREYRAEELVTSEKPEDFKRNISKISFV